jgi:hypothetical protein
MGRHDNVEAMSGRARRWRLALAVGVTLALACVTVEVIEVAGDPVPVDVAIPATAVVDASLLLAQASRAERRPADYQPQLYRADVRRPKDWGS